MTVGFNGIGPDFGVVVMGVCHIPFQPTDADRFALNTSDTPLFALAFLWADPTAHRRQRGT
jgi:hypothetical protein